MDHYSSTSAVSLKTLYDGASLDILKFILLKRRCNRLAVSCLTALSISEEYLIKCKRIQNLRKVKLTIYKVHRISQNKAVFFTKNAILG